MTNNIKLIVISLVISVVVVVGGIAFIGKDNSPKREELGTAKMSIDRKAADLGTMKADEEKSAEFTINNTGNTPLRIWGVVTSCDCTFATMTIGSETTGEFNMAMHMASRLKNWLGEIPPGQKAVLAVIYRPRVMPVQGPITRQVDFKTNDPANANVEVSIAASVQ